MRRVLIVFSVLFGSISARYSSSSSESCEDSHSHEHGNDGGNRGCGAGWRRFSRPSGGWCIKVFQGEMSQASAESKCRSEGGVLSGLQNENEILYITSTAVRLFPERTGSLWVGAKRTSTCSSSPISSSCNSMNSFQWTDNSASGTGGFLWNIRQPDNAHARTQQCLVLLASGQPTVTDKWTWTSNRLDDVACVSPGGSQQRIVRGYVCGKNSNRN